MAEKKKPSTEKKIKKPEVILERPADTKKEVDKTPKKGVNRNLLIGLIGGALAIVLIVLAVLFLRKAPDPSDPKASPTYSGSFFIYNDGKYTLWNKDGKRLTEDEYSAKSSFINGYAYVRRGGEYAILNDAGKAMVDYGRISTVEKTGAGLYLITDNSDSQLLMLGNGKVLLSGDELALDYSSETATFAAAKLDNTYYVFNYAGVLMAQIEAVEDQTLNLSNSEDFGLAYYNGWNLIFDNRTGKQIAMFEGKRFSFDTISDDRSIILLEDYDDGEEYKVIRNGKLYDLSGSKNYGMVRNTNLLIGFDDYTKISLLDNEFKEVRELNSDVAIKDQDNYAVMNDDKAVEIYYRGNLVKTFDKEPDLASGVLLYADLYAIKNDGKYSFYHLDGSVAFGEYADIYSLFDKHHLASVSDDGENYYLINANGNKINDITYRRIYTYDHSYVVYDTDNKRAVLTETGAPVTGFDYSEAYNRSSAVDHEIWSLKRDTNNYDVVDVTAPAEHRILISGVNVYDFYPSYFTVKNDEGGYDYYTYKGMQFYRTTKN